MMSRQFSKLSTSLFEKEQAEHIPSTPGKSWRTKKLAKKSSLHTSHPIEALMKPFKKGTEIFEELNNIQYGSMRVKMYEFISWNE